METWIWLGLVCAFSSATSDALSKKAFKHHHVWLVAWARLLYILPLLWVGFLLEGVPSLDSTFWAVSLSALPLELAATLLYYKALEISPLSLTIPFLALTPVFLIATAFILMGELPTFIGTGGIFLIALGAYLLNLSPGHKTVWDPLKAIGREKGSIYMILVAFIYSITSALGKIAVQHATPLSFIAVYFTLLTVMLGAVVYQKDRSGFSRVFSAPGRFGLIGFFFGLMLLSHFYAIRLTEVAYLISLKRLSLIFSIGYGYLFFRETNIRSRLLGASVMFAGAVVISLWS
ncbi:MAG: EamA family transporter [bacterium]